MESRILSECIKHIYNFSFIYDHLQKLFDPVFRSLTSISSFVKCACLFASKSLMKQKNLSFQNQLLLLKNPQIWCDTWKKYMSIGLRIFKQ